MNRPRRSDSGQSLALFVVMLSALIGFMALGIDGANLFAQRRDAQSVADLAALSGARSLPSAPATARADALAIAAANGYATGVTATTPYGGDDRRIEVTIVKAVRTFFMPFLGVSTVDVGARAVAKAESTTTAAHAIFAGRSNCADPDSYKTIDWSGSNINIVGKVHSNEGILVGGSTDSVTGATTYVCTSEFDGGGTTNRYTPAAQQVTRQPYPATYTTADFLPCTFTGPSSGDWDLTSSGAWWLGGTQLSNQLLPGVYCHPAASGKIKLGYSDVKGIVTFVGPQVQVSGANFVLTPYAKGVLIYAGGTGEAVKIDASGGAWAGIIYAPRGIAEISGSGNLTLSGSIMADQVKLGGSNFNITAGSTSSGVTSIQLVE